MPLSHDFFRLMNFFSREKNLHLYLASGFQDIGSYVSQRQVEMQKNWQTFNWIFNSEHFSFEVPSFLQLYNESGNSCFYVKLIQTETTKTLSCELRIGNGHWQRSGSLWQLDCNVEIIFQARVMGEVKDTILLIFLKKETF